MGYWKDFHWDKEGNQDFVEGAEAAMTAFAWWKD